MKIRYFHHAVLFLESNEVDCISHHQSVQDTHLALMRQRSKAMQTSFMQKSAIARSSMDAATTAQAVFFGKHILVRSLEKLNHQAYLALTAEMTQLEISKKAASMAMITAQQAAEHVEMLNETLRNAQIYAEKTRKAADYANAEYVVQTKLLDKAKERIKTIEQRLVEARNSLAVTRVAAEKAAGAAQEAQSFVVSAAVLAALATQQEGARYERGLLLPQETILN
ncbi:uncharacterized protein LOC119660105 isoform X2 [Hermetia illucens]|uniref:uncharacterized protein LOC119660105 isoform X2 n=1 Tax=Hermetia illucens TaxID=343691 RepID=UPI0018CC00A9|nr:uncharacterized protein LOC119660105 isoform X2 [Hermetia illucens]